MMCVRVMKHHSIVFYSTIRYNTYTLKRHNDSQDLTPEDTIPVFKYNTPMTEWIGYHKSRTIIYIYIGRFILSLEVWIDFWYHTIDIYGTIGSYYDSLLITFMHVVLIHIILTWQVETCSWQDGTGFEITFNCQVKSQSPKKKLISQKKTGYFIVLM
jgi:hypothetical protein